MGDRTGHGGAGRAGRLSEAAPRRHHAIGAEQLHPCPQPRPSPAAPRVGAERRQEVTPLAAEFTAPSIAYSALAPVLIVSGAAVAGVLVEAFAPRAHRWM